jgi:hypothetical protein
VPDTLDWRDYGKLANVDWWMLTRVFVCLSLR